MAKINITLSDDLLAKVDAYADEHYMTRSGFFSMVATDKIQSNDLIKAVNQMSVCIQQIAQNGSLDDKSQKELNDLIVLSDFFKKNMRL